MWVNGISGVEKTDGEAKKVWVEADFWEDKVWVEVDFGDDDRVWVEEDFWEDGMVWVERVEVLARG